MSKEVKKFVDTPAPYRQGQRILRISISERKEAELEKRVASVRESREKRKPIEGFIAEVAGIIGETVSPQHPWQTYMPKPNSEEEEVEVVQISGVTGYGMQTRLRASYPGQPEKANVRAVGLVGLLMRCGAIRTEGKTYVLTEQADAWMGQFVTDMMTIQDQSAAPREG